jgi:endonuclease/exonuclease/phosphatase (EEP) superfamily protein YafD
MTTFLFWNLNKNPLELLVTELAEIHQVDVLILAECEIPASVMQGALNQNPGSIFHLTDSECEQIVIYTRFSSEFLQKQLDDSRLTIRRLSLPGSEEILLAALHHPSKLHWNDASQSAECYRVSSTIRGVEEEVGHRRTVLVGDFNMNPFEDAIIAGAWLNAVMARMVAARGTRTVLAHEYPFFYNPMWGHFGDAIEGPSGTFYDGRSEHVTYFWNMFDQVLIRPALLSIFRNEELKILSAIGERSLVTTRGVPDRSVGSDHLPILFSLDL